MSFEETDVESKILVPPRPISRKSAEPILFLADCMARADQDGRMVAVFFVDETYHAIDDFCPHMGASLAAGAVENGEVMCPWHAWRFKICDGTWCDNPKIAVDSFEVRVGGDEIQVLVPPQNEPSMEKHEE